ncbi:MAG: 23S rRNA (guanosine(2251)-2'-O)-methyltransferase RlmB [Pseudomonadota bacterium]
MGPYKTLPSKGSSSISPVPYMLYGLHTVKNALKNKARYHKKLHFRDQYEKKFIPLANQYQIKWQSHPREWFEKHFEHDVHQHIALETLPLDLQRGEDFLNQDRDILLLDGISDPRNIGALIRSCAAFGFGALIQKKIGVVRESPAMAKAASGGLEYVKMGVVSNLSRFVEKAKRKDFWCVGLANDAQMTVTRYDWSDKIILCVGSEGSGLRPNLQSHLDQMLKIEQLNHAGHSINASVAGAIAMCARFCYKK